MANEWLDFALGDLCSLITDGKHGDCLDEPESGFYFLSVKDVVGNRLVYDRARQIAERDFAETHRRTNLEPGDVLFTNTGTIGRMAIAKNDPKTYRTTFQKSVAILKPKRDVIDPHFLYYLLQFDNAKLSEFAAGTTQKNLLLKDLRSFVAHVPPICEQRAIAQILRSLDDKIELNRQMNETLEGIARALFRFWFVDPIASGLPKEWRVGRLRDCCERVENGGTPKRNEPSYWRPKEIPWLTSGEVRQAIVTKTNNFISQEGLANSSAKLWGHATTVVALYGATAGQVCFIGNEMCANQACCGLVPKLDMRYYVYLHASSSVGALELQARGSAQQNLSQQIVAEFPVIIPDPDTLRRFDNAVHPVFKKWLANIEESSTIGELRDALLPKLLSGQLRLEISRSDSTPIITRDGRL